LKKERADKSTKTRNPTLLYSVYINGRLPPMVTADNVAKLFLRWAYENGDTITNLKIQKLLYYAQAWYLVNYGHRLFDDPIEAWDFGPVIRSIYGKWKKFDRKPIQYVPNNKEESVFDKRQLVFLEEFYRIFSSFSSTALVSMTHNEDPWKKTFVPGENNIISSALMKNYYTKLYERKMKGRKR
jgi:uncharacterized phage-associated protein